MKDLLIVMKALSDKTRMEILELLMHYDFCVGALSRRLGISEASVSQHLKVLRTAGIITGEKRGYYTHYDIKKDMFNEAAAALRAIAEQSVPRQGCKQHLTGEHTYCANLNPPKQQADDTLANSHPPTPSS